MTATETILYNKFRREGYGKKDATRLAKLNAPYFERGRAAMKNPFRSITDIKRANKAIGHHFFDPASMKAFGSRVYAGVIGGKYFITREDQLYSHSQFKVREALPDGSIKTVQGGFATQQEARDYAKGLAGGRQSNPMKRIKRGQSIRLPKGTRAIRISKNGLVQAVVGGGVRRTKKRRRR